MPRLSLRLAARAGLLASLSIPAAVQSQTATSAPDFAMVIHGGAGTILRQNMDRKGNIATTFNSAGMYRGWVRRDMTITVKIYKD